MKHIVTLIFTLLIAAACTENSSVTEVGSDKDTTVVWIEHLEEIDQDVLSDTLLDPEKGWKAFQAFRKFARENPEHPMAPTYHMKAASIARNMRGKSLMAIEEYMAVYNDYPADSLAPQALFLVGFTFDQALNDSARAVKSYNMFIEKFPEHPLADQARGLIKIIQGTQEFNTITKE